MIDLPWVYDGVDVFDARGHRVLDGHDAPLDGDTVRRLLEALNRAGIEPDRA